MPPSLRVLVSALMRCLRARCLIIVQQRTRPHAVSVHPVFFPLLFAARRPKILEIKPRASAFVDGSQWIRSLGVEHAMRAGCSRPRSCRRPTRRWVVIRWANADCKIWHNDTNAPIGYGWHPAAFAGTWGGAYGRWCGSITGASACNSRPTTLLSPGLRRANFC